MSLKLLLPFFEALFVAGPPPSSFVPRWTSGVRGRYTSFRGVSSLPSTTCLISSMIRIALIV
jgi:hypothetical protein